MGLVLVAVLGFLVVGLSSDRFNWRQSVLVGGVAVMLATIQFAFARFL
jgi:MFS-type transporter involved in bile tolerance (Atg22 family)